MIDILENFILRIEIVITTHPYFLLLRKYLNVFQFFTSFFKVLADRRGVVFDLTAIKSGYKS